MRWAYPDTPMPASMSLECKVTLQAPVYVINRLNSSLARLHPQVELVSDQLTCFICFFQNICRPLGSGTYSPE